MKNGFLFIFLLCFSTIIFAQTALTNVAANYTGGKIILSWFNQSSKPIQNIAIQRSYDSLKNFTTIGSVLNPQNIENGFADNNPPYRKMYYRVFVAFEGGSFEYTKSLSAKYETSFKLDLEKSKNATTFLYPIRDKGELPISSIPSISKKLNPVSSTPHEKDKIGNPTIKIDPAKNGDVKVENSIDKPYPSLKVFTAKTNAVTIEIPDYENRKYVVRFYTEGNDFLFELNKITSPKLYIDKVNFERSGWFKFELFEDGKLIERNRIYIPKDGKAGLKDERGR